MHWCDFCESLVDDPCMTNRESWTCPVYLDEEDDFYDLDDYYPEDE